MCLAAAYIYLAAACTPPPVKLALRVKPSTPANASARLLEGDTAATPQACSVPCTIEIPSSTKQEIMIKAPGYYPAVLAVDYLQALRARAAQDAEEATLVVPLDKAPEVTAAATVVEPTAPPSVQ